jgi:tetratricopeptide (TPR) repeat protein
MTIGRLVWLGLLAATLSSSPAAAADPANDALGALTTAEAAARSNDCKTALRIIAEQTGKPAFSKLPNPMLIYAYQLGSACAGQQRDLPAALRYAEAGTAIPGASAQLWQMRFALQFQTGRRADAVATAEAMARTVPEALNQMPAVLWNMAYTSLVIGKQDELRRRILVILTAPSFSLPDPGWSTDRFRRDYAVMLSERNDKAGAVALIAQITDPHVLIEASVDRRIRAAIPADFDARAAAERDMARLRDVAAAHANALRPQIEVAQRLLMLGKPEEAVATLEAIDPQEAGFNDQAEQLAWWWNAKGEALGELGRYEQAALALKKGQALTEHGGPNISQTINLAQLQLHFGRHADALATLTPILEGKIRGSGYGRMAFRLIHGCASFRLGKIKDATADLAYAKQHVTDGPGPLTSLQLCMGDVEGAAASIIKRLDTPDDSTEALLLLSDFAPPAPTAPPDPNDAVLARVKERTDVQAAIARAGGTRRFNVVR